MTKRHGYALLAALTALTAVLSACIYAGVTAGHGTGSPRTAPTGVAGHPPHSNAAPASTGTWVGTWSAAPSGAEPGTETDGAANMSVRNVVHTSVAGTSARVTLSNLYGQEPLTVTDATVAVAAGDSTAAAADGTLRRLTFGGSTSVTVPAGRQVVSDAVRVNVPRDTNLLVTTYSPTSSGSVTYHQHARQISYAAEGDSAEDMTGTPYTEQVEYWRYLTAVDVLSNEATGTIVAFGDSLTDGITSTEGADHRWPDYLSERLREATAAGRDVPRYSVVNEGVSGNQVLLSGLGRPADNASGLDRFGRDVLRRANAKVVVIDLGINDIGRNKKLADPDKVLAGLRTLVGQAHARGLKVVGATLMPFGGHDGWTAARNTVREQINARIRAGTVFDTVVDFDKALRDPADPVRLRPDLDSGDHLHPSDKGFRKMADAFDLTALDGGAPAEL